MNFEVVDSDGNDLSTQFILWRRPATPPAVARRRQLAPVSTRPSPCVYTKVKASVVSMEGGSATPHLHRRVRTVQRWKFDNTRQQQQQQQRLQRLHELQNNGAEEIEMRAIKGRRYD
ncbi:hypothetical protein JYU34_000681 [Plutella xylostella]|uniref:Uncharacterized protein n=1 Tax=Plutella xylostella TaxID=51655 RepID=A0ABQ7R8D0_PLUXY|nr:hypothetical protein JYU34_000681 [Plutella xylostella]